MNAEPLSASDSVVLDALPCEDRASVLEGDQPNMIETNDRSLLGLAEMLLKAPAQLDVLTRDPARQPELIPRLLTLALASTSLFAIMLVLLLLAAEDNPVPVILVHWDRSLIAPVKWRSDSHIGASGLGAS